MSIKLDRCGCRPSASSVVVPVMHIRQMCMAVPHRGVSVGMAVCTNGHHVMVMIVVAVIVAVGMLVLQCLMFVFVVVRLG